MRYLKFMSLLLTTMALAGIAGSPHGCAQESLPAGAGVQVLFWTNHSQYKRGEPIIVSYGVRNAGQLPLLVKKDLELVFSPSGGFEIQFFDSHGLKMDLGFRSAAYYPTPEITALQRDTPSVSLNPGQFFGQTTQLRNVPRIPGRYKVVAQFTAGSTPLPETALPGKNQHFQASGSYVSDPVFLTIQ